MFLPGSFGKGKSFFLNGGDPDILHAWPDAYIRLRLHLAGQVPQLDLISSFKEFPF